MLNFIPPGLEGQLGLSNRFTFTHDPSPVALTDAGKTWITDINVKSQEKVHLMMDPPRICIWGPPNNSIKYQTQFTPKSTRVIHKVCQISLVRCSKCSPDRGRTLLTGWKCRVHKRHHLFGIILGCCTEKANLCFKIPRFLVKKLKFTNRRKLSKMLLFRDLREKWRGPRVSGSAKFYSILYQGKFFIMSTEFDKNISDWSHYCTDHKNGNDFFMSLVKWPKIAVKKSQIF